MNDTLKKIRDFVLNLSAEEITLAQETLENGTILEADSFEAGQAVYIVNPDGNVPLPAGEYQIGDMMLVVEEDGIIAAMNPIEEAPAEEVPAEEAPAEEVAAIEYVSVEDFNMAIEEIKSMMADLIAMIDDKEAAIAEMSAEKVELQKELSEKEDALKINHAPIELKAVPASNGKERILERIRNTK